MICQNHHIFSVYVTVTDLITICMQDFGKFLVKQVWFYLSRKLLVINASVCQDV